MNTTDSQVSTWRRLDRADALLEHIEARKRNEPYMAWNREGRMLFISEIPDLSMEQLQALVHDMSARIESLRSEVDAERLLLSTCGTSAPMQAKASRVIIGRINRAIESTKQFLRDAGRELDKRNPPKIKKSQDNKPQDFDFVQSKREYFSRKALLRKLVPLIGKKQFDTLSREAKRHSALDFKNWCRDKIVDADWVEHILQCEAIEIERQEREEAVETQAA